MKTTDKYRIDIYGFRQQLIRREYHDFVCCDDAKIYAYWLMQQLKASDYNIQLIIK